MYLERGRAVAQGGMILIFAGVANWVSLPVGLGVIALLGVARLQESLTDWCPSDPFLRLMGCKKRGASKGS